MADVFVSYARSDEAAARRVAKTLQDRGYSVWWDDDLPAHRAYSEVIERQLDEASAVVVLWSAESARSQWVRAEADVARNGGKLVQASLDGAMPPLPFNQIQCASLKGWRGSPRHPAWAKLEASVAALVRGEAAAEGPTTAAPAGWRRLFANRAILAGIAALLLVAIAFLAYQTIGGEGAERPIVAVLPFESLDRRDESLVAGIWEDTRQAIGRNPQLLVLGPNTSEEIAEKGDKTARKLADYLVEASVRSAGDRIRVTANLVRTDDGSEVWNKSFERRLDDVFALQSEIAREIEGHIRGRLAERGGVQPHNIATTGEVYALYSDARAKFRKRQMAHYEEAFSRMQQVVRMDPNFAPGWATLSVMKGFQEQTREAEADARRAIALAPNLAAGHAALGFALLKGPAAQASLRRALQLDPNDIEAMNWLANSMDRDTQARDRVDLYSKIVDLEPLWWPAIFNLANQLFHSGGYELVEQEIDRLEELGNESGATLLRMELAKRKGDLSTAVTLGLERYRAARSDERQMVANALVPPLAQLQMFEVMDRVSPPPFDWIPYVRTNDPRALEAFEKQFNPRQFWTFAFVPIIGPRIYVLNGQSARLAKQYHKAASSPEAFVDLVGKDYIADVAPTVALALKQVGEDQEASRLIGLALANADVQVPTSEDKLVRLARIYAVQGRKEEALGALSAAVRRGWLPPQLPHHVDLALDPPLAELKGDPRFGRLRRQILDHLKKERAELGPVGLDASPPQRAR